MPVKPVDSVANQFYIGFTDPVSSRKGLPSCEGLSRALDDLRDRFIIKLETVKLLRGWLLKNERIEVDPNVRTVFWFS